MKLSQLITVALAFTLASCTTLRGKPTALNKDKNLQKCWTTMPTTSSYETVQQCSRTTLRGPN